MASALLHKRLALLECPSIFSKAGNPGNRPLTKAEHKALSKEIQEAWERLPYSEALLLAEAFARSNLGNYSEGLFSLAR